MLPSFGARGGLPTGQQFRGNSVVASNPELCLLEARQRPQTGVKMAKLSFLKASPVPPPPLPPSQPLPLPPLPPPPPPLPQPLPLPSAAPPVRLWTEIFRVDKSNDVLGNQKAIGKLRKWVQFRVSGQFSKTFPLVAFVSGPAGTGKTTVVNNLLREAGAHVQEVNASEERRKEAIMELIYGTCTRKPLTGKQASGLVLDEIDGASKEDGNGAIAALLEFLKVADALPFVSPIICICNDRSNRQLRTLAAKCLDIRFFPLLRKPMEMIAQKIQKRARIYVPESLLKSYITAAGGDARKLINLLYLRPQNESRLRLHAGDAFSDSFATTRFLLRGTDSLSMLEHLYHQDPDAMALLCQENYPEVCDTLEDFVPWATLFSDVNDLEQGWSLTYWDPNDYVGSLLALNARIHTKRRDPNNVAWPKWFEANRKTATQMDTINYDKLVQRCDFRSLFLQQDLMKKRNE